MIQPLRTAKIVWIADWLDLDVPAPIGNGEQFVLPTCVLVASDNGSKLLGQEVFRELDQRRMETLLARLMQEHGSPDSITIRFTDEWDDLAWETFARNYRCDIDFVEPEKEDPLRQFEQISRLKQQVAAKIEENTREVLVRIESSPAGIAAGLVRAASQVRSPAKRSSMLLHAIKLDRNCTEAMVALGDLEFQTGNLKQAMQHFSRALRIEDARIGAETVHWWEDKTTRPFLKATHGRLMTRWHQGDLAGAISDAEDLLRLNAKDHQGVRFLLPLLYLLADQIEAATHFYQQYRDQYPKDFSEPAFLFGWGLTLWHADDEKAASEVYRKAMVRNLFIAPLMLDLPEPPIELWIPNDRAEPGYALEFFDSFGVLWEREPSALRFLREVYDKFKLMLDQLTTLRLKMSDFQDQRYEPEHEAKWKLLTEEERGVTGEGISTE